MPEQLEEACVLSEHRGYVSHLSRERLTLVSGSRDGTVLAWDTETNKPTRTIRGHEGAVNAVALSADCRELLTGGKDSTVRLWDLRSNESRQVRRFKHDNEVTSVALLSSVGSGIRGIASGSLDCSARIWDAAVTTNEYCVHELLRHTDGVTAVTFAENGGFTSLVTASKDSLAVVWDTNKLKESHVPRAVFEKHGNGIKCITVSPDGSLLCTGGVDGSAKLWQIENTVNAYLYEFSVERVVTAVCYNPMRYWLCVGHSDGLTVFDLETKTEIIRVTTPNTTSLSWSMDGTVLYAGYSDGKIRVWRLNSIAE